MIERIKKYINLAKDYIFPVFCLGCGEEVVWLCEDCQKKIDASGIWCCPVCHHETSIGVCCGPCQKESFLDAHLAIAPYQEESLIGKLIAALKYQYAEEVKVVFASLIKKFVSDHSDVFQSIDIIIPVPLHKKRFAERGYNQAEIIAMIAGKELNLPILNALERHRPTKQQAKLKREERLVNLKDAFILKPNADVGGKKILLVDDVFTTGSTMQECAGVLKKAGAVQVKGFSAARG